MELIAIPPHSAFIGHVNVQQSGAGWNGTRFQRYDMNVMHERRNLRDALLYTFWRPLRLISDINRPNV